MLAWQQIALNQAQNTWDQDPFRHVISATGRPTFDIDFPEDTADRKPEISTVKPTMTPSSVIKPAIVPQEQPSVLVLGRQRTANPVIQPISPMRRLPDPVVVSSVASSPSSPVVPSITLPSSPLPRVSNPLPLRISEEETTEKSRGFVPFTRSSQLKPSFREAIPDESSENVLNEEENVARIRNNPARGRQSISSSNQRRQEEPRSLSINSGGRNINLAVRPSNDDSNLTEDKARTNSLNIRKLKQPVVIQPIRSNVAINSQPIRSNVAIKSQPIRSNVAINSQPIRSNLPSISQLDNPTTKPVIGAEGKTGLESVTWTPAILKDGFKLGTLTFTPTTSRPQTQQPQLQQAFFQQNIQRNSFGRQEQQQTPFESAILSRSGFDAGPARDLATASQNQRQQFTQFNFAGQDFFNEFIPSESDRFAKNVDNTFLNQDAGEITDGNFVKQSGPAFSFSSQL